MRRLFRRTKKRKEAQEIDSRKRVEMAAKIFQEYGDMIFNVINLQVNDKSKADDIFQEFFLSLIRHPIPSDINNLRSYIYRAIRNDVIDDSQKGRFYKTRLRKYAQQQQYTITCKKPEENLELHEEAEKMLDLIQSQLPLHESTALIKKCYNGKNNKETGEIMGIDKRSVSRYTCTGLKRLRKFISQEGDAMKWTNKGK